MYLTHGFFFGLYNPEEQPAEEDNYEGAPEGSFKIYIYSSGYGCLKAINVIADLVGFNFYRIRDVWVLTHNGDYYTSPYLTDWVKENSSGGLIYARPDNYEDEMFDERLEKIDDDRFKDDIVNLVDLLARSDEQ